MGMYTIPAVWSSDGGWGFPSGHNYYGKFQIRLLRRAKDVYVHTGLSHIFDVINNLNRLAGDPPLPGPKFSDWSFRHDVIPYTGLIPTEPVHLRDIMNFIEQTPPVDLGQKLFYSFRDLLSV